MKHISRQRVKLPKLYSSTS